MKKTFTKNNKLLWIAALLVVVFSAKSCRKDRTPEVEKQVSQNVQWAKNYYESKLQPNQGNLLAPNKMMSNGSATGKSRTNKISIRWDEGVASKTPDYDFVEVPMNMDGRIIPTIITTKNPDVRPVLDQEVINASLTRLIIYKDETGTTSERIITYVPDRDYLTKAKGNISKNRIDKLDKDFFGYLEYKDWNGKVLWLLRIENGKSVRKIDLAGAMSQADAIKLSGSRSSGGQGKMMRYEVVNCGEWTLIYQWQQWCYYEGQSQTPYSCDPPEVYNSQLIPNCPLGGGPPTSVDCSNPVNFENAACAAKVEIDTSALAATYPCMVRLILKKLESNANFKKMTDPFRKPMMPNGTPINIPGLPNLSFASSSMSYGTNTIYQLGETGYDQTWSAAISFNSQAIQNASVLFLQATAIHEMGHAYAHFYLKAGSYDYDMSVPMYKTWGMKIIDYAAVLKGEKDGGANYTDHSIFLENYYETAWQILKDINGSAYTDKEYQMAMLYGLNQSGDAPAGGLALTVYNAYDARLQKSFDNIKAKYGITSTELNSFNLDNLVNVPANKKLPTNCP